MELKHIVVGVDFSRESELAAFEAVDLASRTGADVTLVYADYIEDRPTMSSPMAPDWAATVKAHADASLETLQNKFTDRGVKLARRVAHEAPAEGLSKVAADVGADLVLTGTHGRTGFRRFLMGSVAEHTVRLCSCDVMVVRGGGDSEAGYRRILVPTDFSDHAEKGLQRALEMVAPGGSVDLVHFWQLPLAATDGLAIHERVLEAERKHRESEAHKDGKALLEKYKTDHCELSFEVENGSAAHGIVDRAAVEGHDAIMLGSHGRRGFRRFVIGSVAETVVRHAPCSVLVTRLPKE